MDSVFNYYHRLTSLRKSADYKEVFTYGDFEPAFADDDNMVMAYYRTNKEKRILIAANFGSEPVELVLEYPAKRVLLRNMHSGLLLSDSRDSTESMDSTSGLKLDSCEVCVMECKI